MTMSYNELLYVCQQNQLRKGGGLSRSTVHLTCNLITSKILSMKNETFSSVRRFGTRRHWNTLINTYYDTIAFQDMTLNTDWSDLWMKSYLPFIDRALLDLKNVLKEFPILYRRPHCMNGIK